MKRFSYWILVMTVVALGACSQGCRRRASTPHTPVSATSEKDVVTGPDEAALVFSLRSADRKYKLATDMDLLEARLDQMKKEGKDPAAELTKLVSGQEMMEKDTKLTPIVTKMKEEREKIDKANEFKALALSCVEFFKNNPVKAYSEENLIRFLRKTNQVVKRKYVDKTSYTIVAEEIQLRRFLEDKQVAAVMEVDMRIRDQVIVYRVEGDAQGGNMTVTSDGIIKLIKADELKRRVKDQEMQMLARNYVEYLDNLRKNNALDQRSLDGFKKQLKENATPGLSKRVEDNTILVVDPRIATSWIAFYAVLDSETKAHFGVALNGGTGFVPPATMQAFFPPKQ
jgi:hypothetical protein